MKKAAVIFALLLASQGNSPAQTNQVELATPKETETKPQAAKLAVPSDLMLKKKLKKEVELSGILIQVRRSTNVLQLINPRAPAKYGQGWVNVRSDVAGKSTGLSLISVDF